MPSPLRRVMPLLLALFAGLLPGAAIVIALDSEQRDAPTPARVIGVEASQSGDERQITAGETPTEEVTATVYLPLFFRSYLAEPFDMVDFLVGDDRLFEVQFVPPDGGDGPQARHQTQIEGERFFHTKGNEISAEWEELWYDDAYIYRGTDTSPGNGQYYTLRDPGQYGSKWAPRMWKEGQLFYRDPHVTFYDKSNCQPVMGGTQGSYLRLDNYYKEYTFESGITLKNVIELSWLLRHDGEPIERYYYAEFYGLVGWQSSSGAYSYINEIHGPGERPDNVREEIPCLDTSPTVPEFLRGVLPYWPGVHRR